MDQRNLVCTNQESDLERNPQNNQQQPQPHILPDPSILSRSMPNMPMSQPSFHTVLSTSSNSTNYNLHHHPSIEGGFFHGMMPYHDVPHHHPAGNLNIGGAAAIGSGYYPFMTASRPFHLHQNNGYPDHLPSSSNHATTGVPIEGYTVINQFVPVFPFKRKIAEGGIVSSNIQYFGSMDAGSSSAAVAPVPHEAVVIRPPNAMSFPDYRVNRNVSGGIELDLAMARNNNNHLVQPSYMGQNTNPPPMLDQLQFGRTSIDGGPLTWSPAPPGMNYFPGINGGFVVPGCQDATANRTFFHISPPLPQGGHPIVHHPPLPLMAVRSHNINYHSQLPAGPSLRPANSPPATTFPPNPVQNGNIETGPRFVGHAVPPSGFRIYRPLGRTLIPEANPRHNNLPSLRILPADEVAMLNISGYYEVGSSVDRHSDMRLDIDHMTYEELLALGEQIGHVETGLTEEAISKHLKTRTPPQPLSKTSPNHEAASVAEIATDFCVVCQNDYKKQEKIGSLECGHEYHVECIKQWLLVKNICPICKAPALTIKGEEEDGEEVEKEEKSEG